MEWQTLKRVSPQRIYQIIKGKRKQSKNMLSDEESAYICAAEDGVDLHKFLAKQEVEKIRDLSLIYPNKDDQPIVAANNLTKSKKEKKVKSVVFTPNYETEFIEEANLNNKAYPHIYVIENTLRKIILSIFGDSKDWWIDKIVSKDVTKVAENIRVAESNHPWVPKRGKHPIYYVGLEELKKIISKNWDAKFKWIGEAEKFRLWIDELIPIRNMVAHNSPISRDELRTIEEKARWLIIMINNRVPFSQV